MRVAIAGGGIGGLTAALMLHDAGVDATVYESVGDPRPLGLGINVLPSAVAELKRLGVLDELLPLGVATAELCYVNRHGQFIFREPRGLAAGYPVPQLSIHRGRLQLALLEIARRTLPGGAVRFASQVLGYAHRRGGVVALEVFDRVTGRRFTDTADVFVGADGIHSTVRAVMYPHEGPPRWSGEILWRAATRAPEFLTGRSMVLIGHRGRKVIAYPISAPDTEGNALINWIAVLDRSSRPTPPREDWNRPGRLDDFVDPFATWSFTWLDVVRLMRAADGTYEFPMVDRDPLPRWTAGSVTLLGDAAHPMYPVGSNGATQSILDARALTAAIAEERDPTDALERYERERRPATARVVAANREQGAARILDLAEKRARDGFASSGDVFASGELEQIAASYRGVSGFSNTDVERALDGVA